MGNKDQTKWEDGRLIVSGLVYPQIYSLVGDHLAAADTQLLEVGTVHAQVPGQQQQQ